MNRQQYNYGNAPRDHPAHAEQFYTIVPRDDGLVDVYLSPVVSAYDTDLGIREYDVAIRVVSGVEPSPEIEEDIRLRYDAWCDSADVIYL